MRHDPNGPEDLRSDTPMGEDRTVVVHDDLDRPEVRAVARARAAAMRRLAIDMADVMAVREIGPAHPGTVTARTSHGATDVVVTMTAQLLNDWSLRTWTITSTDGARPDDEVAILLPRVRGTVVNRAPDIEQLHRLAVILHHAAAVLEHPDDHPTELDWIRAVATMLEPLRGIPTLPRGMTADAEHLSSSPVTKAKTLVTIREDWMPVGRPTGETTSHVLDLPEGMLLTTIGEGHRPTLEAIESTLSTASRHDPMDVLRSLAKLDGNPVWKAHRERRRRP